MSTTASSLLAFFEELRSEGVAVGTSEILDAFAALDEVSWTDQRDFRESLAATIAKSQEDRRIFELLAPLAAQGHFSLDAATDLDGAMTLAKTRLRGDGVVLLSPGAPSFGAYRDYTERGRHFAALAGFDPDAITSIAGLGIA